MRSSWDFASAAAQRLFESNLALSEIILPQRNHAFDPVKAGRRKAPAFDLHPLQTLGNHGHGFVQFADPHGLSHGVWVPISSVP
jgi:hypothetical protein